LRHRGLLTGEASCSRDGPPLEVQGPLTRKIQPFSNSSFYIGVLFVMMKRIIAASLAASSLCFAANAHAEAGDFVVRLRATNVSPDESSSLGKTTDQAYGAGTAVALYGSAGAELRVDDNWIPEIDFSYYFTKNIAAELILATGTRHDVKTSGAGALLTTNKLGSVNLLPPNGFFFNVR
jgi:outer membrane protein